MPADLPEAKALTNRPSLLDLSTPIKAAVLAIHHRNGGKLKRLDFSLRLLDPVLLLDSLDLAEIMVTIERGYGCSPFDEPVPPKTWRDVVGILEGLSTPDARRPTQ